MDQDNKEMLELLKAIDRHIQAGFIAAFTLARQLRDGSKIEPYQVDITESDEFIRRLAESLKS